MRVSAAAALACCSFPLLLLPMAAAILPDGDASSPAGLARHHQQRQEDHVVETEAPEARDTRFEEPQFADDVGSMGGQGGRSLQTEGEETSGPTPSPHAVDRLSSSALAGSVPASAATALALTMFAVVMAAAAW